MGNTPKILEAGAPGFSQMKKKLRKCNNTIYSRFENFKYSTLKYYCGEVVVIMPCPRSMQLSCTAIVFVINSHNRETFTQALFE
jgi:hypothetical protein